jgi:hypothetical protein
MTFFICDDVTVLYDVKVKLWHSLALERRPLMQIKPVEVSQFQKLLFVDHCDVAAVKLNHVVFTQLFHNSIDVDRGNSHGFPKLLLCQRHLESGPLNHADHFQALSEFDDNMSKPVWSRALSHIDDPLPKHCGVDQGVSPEDFCDVRSSARNLTKGNVADEAQGAFCERREIMIQHTQMKALEVGYFAGYVDGENLPPAV